MESSGSSSSHFSQSKSSRLNEASSFISSSPGDVSIPGGVAVREFSVRPIRSVSSASTSGLSKSRTTPNTPLRTANAARTPGSTSSCVTSLSVNSNVVMAIVEGRGMARGEIGLASMDFTFPVLKVMQFSDSQSYVKLLNKLEIEQPVILLLPHTMYRSDGSSNNLLYETITESSRAAINLVQRRYFSNVVGLQYIKQLCLADCLQTVQLQLQNKYYALAAVAALIKYAEFVQSVVFAPSSLRVDYVGCDQIMFIDSRTARYLELVENLVDPEADKTLYGVLNYTQTFGGMRMLRSNILQPPFDDATVAQRLLAVSELVAPEHEQLLVDLRSLFARWPDVERVISLFVQKPCKESKKTMDHRITQFIVLKQIVDSAPALQAVLTRCSSPLFVACRALLDGDSFTDLKTQILEVINEDVYFQKNRQGMTVQKTLLIKEGVHEMLDVCRRAYMEVLSDINDYVSELATKHGIPLRLANNSLRAYHIQLPASCCGSSEGSESDKPITQTRRGRGRGQSVGSISVRSSPASTVSSRQLPADFIKVSRFRGIVFCTTTYLISLNNRLQDAENEVLFLTNNVLMVLIEKIQPFVSCLYKLAESVALVDLLVSLADASLAGGYVSPRFENALALKKSRHPILDHFSPRSVVANDAFAEPGSNFILITGPNMSGKSTYLKQIALIQVMAQIGCFVPASFAALRLTDRLFARLDTNDDIETNLSSFMLEVREMSYILANVTSNSLIIVDEFARATSPDEGFGISFAVCEELLMSKAFTFFATHFTGLGLLASLYANVDAYCFELERLNNSHSAPSNASDSASSTGMISFYRAEPMDQRQSNSSSAGGEQTSRLAITHRLRTGVVQTEHYGIQLVELTLMPREVLEEAKIHIKRLDALHTRQRRVMEQASVSDIRLAKFRLVSLLLRIARHADANSANTNIIRDRLQKLKTDFAPILSPSASG